MWNAIATRTNPSAPIDLNTLNEERAAIRGGQCASAPTTFHLLGFSSFEPITSNAAMIVISRYAWIRPTQTIGFCRMKPNTPVPVIRPMVVATALANATSVRIVPWIRSSRRRKRAMLDVGCVVRSFGLGEDTSLGGSHRAEQIPAIALQVQKHGDLPVRLQPWCRHEHDTRSTHARISCGEIIDA